MNYFNKQFKKILLIAEIGVNHDGKISKALKLIDKAKTSGADAVKFQTFKAENLSTKKTSKTKYQIKFTGKKDSHFEMLKKLELTDNEFIKIKLYCKKKKIIFISTPYDSKSAKFLNSINVRIFKIASADISDYLLNNTVSIFNKPTIISTGTSSNIEIKRILKVYKNKSKIALLHCVSNYPSTLKSLNLRCIPAMAKKYKIPVGFSDHTKSLVSGAIAVALGAKIIEKHFTLNCKDKGPDHYTSLNPKEFKEYTQSIRDTEKMLGTKDKKLQKEEIDMKQVSRKSLYYARKLKKGVKISANDFLNLRPGTGINSFEIRNLVNKKLKKNVAYEQKVSKSDFNG
jgi:N,N'-diacetyllegionaminate synthase